MLINILGQQAADSQSINKEFNALKRLRSAQSQGGVADGKPGTFICCFVIRDRTKELSTSQSRPALGDVVFALSAV